MFVISLISCFLSSTSVPIVIDFIMLSGWICESRIAYKNDGGRWGFWRRKEERKKVLIKLRFEIFNIF